MAFVIVAIIVFFLWLTFPKNVANIKKPCGPHKWEYRKQPGQEDEYLICTECSKLPGVDSND